MSKLFEEIKIKDISLKNRVIMAPMCMYTADTDGIAKDFHFIHYATRAIGGVSMVIVEATGIEECGRISDRDLGVWNDTQIEGLARIADLIKSNGAVAAIQISHAGRKSEVTYLPVIAPSSVRFSDDYKVPEEMTVEDIKRVVNSFKEAAVRVSKAGFEAIEIHGAHGYLINQFLSPLINKRTDQYGGSRENRARFMREVIEAVREVWPIEKPLFLRVSAEDYEEGGNKAEDLAYMINLVKDLGIDLVDVSTGGVVNTPVKAYPGYQIEHAEIIKKETGIPVVAGGLITEPSFADEVFRSRDVDMLFLGRVLLRKPYWTLEAAHDLGVDVEWPKQYLRGKF